MAARAAAFSNGNAWRLWALAPILLLSIVVGAFVTSGSLLVDLIGKNPPPADAFDVRRVAFEPGEIRVRVTNPQHEQLTIASVAVDDAIVPFEVDGPRELGRLRSSTIIVAYDWVEDEPITVGITSSSGIETVEQVAAAVETPTPSARGFVGYGIIGLLVGVVPVMLGLLWLPSLRRIRREWLAAFMALTAGLLSFLAIEALAEAFDLQRALPGSLGGAGLVLLGVATSYLSMTFLSSRLARRGRSGGESGAVTGPALALLVAIGIGVHNLGEGLAIGTSFAFGELTLGTFLIVGFMIHNVSEGLGIAAPIAEDANAGGASGRRLALLALVAGGPAILGAWLGGYVANDILAVAFFGAAAGAALEVVVEVGRFVARRAPGGLRSGYAVGGYLAGIAVMYLTGLLAA
jgi:ZIP family zinc transporter